MEFGRLRGDLIETYEILRGFVRVDAERMFPFVGESGTRRHSLKIRALPFQTEIRGNLFTEGH